ncbi:MAG: hypothetical protein H7Z75_14365 [Ferruginibacter sp.]|nr:hypothetical protein [Cytophagales bacterium]
MGKVRCLRDEMQNLGRVAECTRSFRYKDFGRKRRLNEVSVQRWKEGQVIHGRFWYTGFLEE